MTHSKNGGLAQLARAPALHAGGHRFDSDILHNSHLCDPFFDILDIKKRYKIENITRVSNKFEKVTKGVWRMPRLSEAMKDVISCDKLREGAHNH